MNMSADFFKINLAGRLRKKLTDKNITIINRASGLMFIIFGTMLILGVWWSVKHS
jgi:threonine/homoserine/homoserine lactone efflux protein